MSPEKPQEKHKKIIKNLIIIPKIKSQKHVENIFSSTKQLTNTFNLSASVSPNDSSIYFKQQDAIYKNDILNDKYVVQDKIGFGICSNVYLTKSISDGEQYAIKVYNHDLQAQAKKEI